MEKSGLIDRPAEEWPASAWLASVWPQSIWQRRYAARLSVAAAVLLCYMVYSMPGVSPPICGLPAHLPRPYTPQTSNKVPLEIHIMSKCPDARDCLKELVLPAMEQIADQVDFKMSFIGKTTDSDDGVECMHGAGECLGNIVELCAAKVYEDPKLYLGYTMCLFQDYTDVPVRWLLKDCALEHGIDFDKLNACASDDDGATGMDMLRRSVEHSAALNVTRSCTIRLDNEIRCIRDAGEWKDCEDGSSVDSLVADIKKLSEARTKH